MDPIFWGSNLSNLWAQECRHLVVLWEMRGLIFCLKEIWYSTIFSILERDTKKKQTTPCIVAIFCGIVCDLVRIVDANIQHAIAFAKLMVKVVGVSIDGPKVWGASIGHVEYTLHPLKTNNGSQQTVWKSGGFNHFWKGETFHCR